MAAESRMFWLLLLALTGTKALQLRDDVPEQWPKYPGRKVTSLAGDWGFSWHGDGSSSASATKTISVPSVMHNPPPGEISPMGFGIYTRGVQLEAGKEGLLEFRGCGFYCQVYIDGELLADHKAGGYQPFWVRVPQGNFSTRSLMVLVERTWRSDKSPLYVMQTPEDALSQVSIGRMHGGDMSHYGGIHRDVFLHEVTAGKLYIKDPVVSTQSLKPQTLDHINVRFTAEGERSTTSLKVSLQWDDETEKNVVEANYDSNGMVELQGLKVPNAKAWSPTSPSLHRVRLALVSENGDESDAVQVRFGLREIKASKDGFTLNGKPLLLKGVNRQSTTPESASALTMEEIKKDIALVSELGANFVRGVHYPQDQRFLDLCDEAGIMVWEEPLTWGTSLSRLKDETYRKQLQNGIEEMIVASANHPSVVIWGLFNEGPSDEADACQYFKEFVDLIRKKDSTRLITWAHTIGHNKSTMKTDVCQQPAGADFIAINSFPGWYGKQELNAETLATEWKSIIGQLKEQTGKPVVVAETGAEGIWEMSAESETPAPYSQQFQAKLLEIVLPNILQAANGVAVAQFADSRAGDANVHYTDWEVGPVKTNAAYLPHCVSTIALTKQAAKAATKRCTLFKEPRCQNAVGVFPEPITCDKVEFPQDVPVYKQRFFRPKGMKNTGILDFWRRKKLAFNIVKIAFESAV